MPPLALLQAPGMGDRELSLKAVVLEVRAEKAAEAKKALLRKKAKQKNPDGIFLANPAKKTVFSKR